MIADPHKLGNPDAFDDLADLFLGQMGRVHAHDAAVGAVPMARGVDHEGSAVQASARGPITTAERSPPAPRLTLVSDEEARRVEPAARAMGGEPPCVEALVLGHLPVMSAGWATQYVRHVADRVQGPVAMVRLGCGVAGTARIELHAPAGCRPEVRVGKGFESALATIHAGARRVVLVGPSASEMEVVGTAGVGRVTLLTSGDEAGIVAAYGLVKSIAGRLREGRGIDPAGVLRVAVMGSPPSRADVVIGRLREAARAFLGLELSSDTCIARIGSAPGQAGIVLYEGVLEATIEDLVAMVGVGSVSAVEPRLTLREDRSGNECGTDESGGGGEETEPPTEERAGEVAGPRCGNDAPAVAGVEPATEGPGPGEPALCGYVDGVTPIEARCPYAEEVEIGIKGGEDGMGGWVLHVAVRAERYGERGRALERLAIAAEWARSHRRVLELTLRGSVGASAVRLADAEPARHVFTDQPAQWRRLLDAGVRVHALVPTEEKTGDPAVVVGSARGGHERMGGWVSVAIN